MPDIINEVRPFQAIHYDPQKIANVGLCLAQPYDVISPEQQEAYYRRHEYNVVRLILNRITPADDERDNRYTRARDMLRRWRQEGILCSTHRPSFYVYEEEFDVPDGSRRKVKGFIGLVRLSEYREGAILPHEKIMIRPLEDRIRLTEATRAQFEYIWGLYRDRAYVIDDILDAIERDPPIISYMEESTRVRHRMWRLVDPGQCEIVRRTMQRQKIYIADGHHRYQAMLTFRDEMRRRHPEAGPQAPWEFIMMFLVNTEHEGLTILPVHRLLHNLQIGNLGELKEAIQEHFHVKSYPFRNGDDMEARRKWLRDLKEVEPGVHKLGAFIAKMNRYFLLTLKDEEAYEELVDIDSSSEWKLLDVNILNTLILNQIVGLSDEQLALQTSVEYTKDIDDAIHRVAAGWAQVALILNPTRLQDVVTIAENGEKMPRKSTFFYPKPLSGLLFYGMDGAKEGEGGHGE
jgi:uncharacterized protein (DUF1015 family)